MTVCCRPKELVCSKKNIRAIHELGDHELFLYPLEAILGFHGNLSLREGGGVSLQELTKT
jgi:hypothetical protein